MHDDKKLKKMILTGLLGYKYLRHHRIVQRLASNPLELCDKSDCLPLLESKVNKNNKKKWRKNVHFLLLMKPSHQFSVDREQNMTLCRL